MKFGKFELFVLRDGCFKIIYSNFFKTGVNKTPVSISGNNWFKPESVTLGVNLLLIKTGTKNILIDTGIGTKIPHRKFRSYDIDFPRKFIEELNYTGLQPADIDYVISTHLHFDHAGGNTIHDAKKNPLPAFPNAKHVIQKKEFDHAIKEISTKTNTAYISENIQPLIDTNSIELIDGNYTLTNGVELRLVGGHTPGLQIIKITSEDKTAIFPSDLIPTPWQVNSVVPEVNFDNEKLEEEKKIVIREAIDTESIVFFQHSPRFLAGYLREEDADKKIGVKRVNGFTTS